MTSPDEQVERIQHIDYKRGSGRLETLLTQIETLILENRLLEAAVNITCCWQGYLRAERAFMTRADRENTDLHFLKLFLLTKDLRRITAIIQIRHPTNIKLEFHISQKSTKQARYSIEFQPMKLSITFDKFIICEKAATQALWLDWIIPVFISYSESSQPEYGSVAFSSADDAYGPGLSMCSNRPDCFLIPDNVFVPSHGYRIRKEQVLKNSVPWSDRREVAFWRGSTTGQPFEKGDWKTLPRLELCRISRSLPHILDAGITQVIQISDPEAEQYISSHGLSKNFVSATEFDKYKYQVDIDGNTNAWSGLFTKLLSGSPVLKVASHLHYEQWYYDRLQPWVNYVPVLADMDDLLEKIEWLKKHDTLAEKIGSEGRALAFSMDYGTELQKAHLSISSAIRTNERRPEIIQEHLELTGTSVILGPDTEQLAGNSDQITPNTKCLLQLIRPLVKDDLLLEMRVATTKEVLQYSYYLKIKDGSNTIIRQLRLERSLIQELIPYSPMNKQGSQTIELGVMRDPPISREELQAAFQPDLRILWLSVRALSTVSLLERKTLGLLARTYLERGREIRLLEYLQVPQSHEPRFVLKTAHNTIVYLNRDTYKLQHGESLTLIDDLILVRIANSVATFEVVDANKVTTRLEVQFSMGILSAKKTPESELSFTSTSFEVCSAIEPGKLQVRLDRLFMTAQHDGCVSFSASVPGGWEEFSLIAYGDTN